MEDFSNKDLILLIKKKLQILDIKSTLTKRSEIMIMCQKLTNNIYLFKNIDCSNTDVLKTFIEDILENTDRFRMNCSNESSETLNKNKMSLKKIIKDTLPSYIVQKIENSACDIRDKPVKIIEEDKIELSDYDSDLDTENDSEIDSELGSEIDSEGSKKEDKDDTIKEKEKDDNREKEDEEIESILSELSYNNDEFNDSDFSE